MRELSLTLLLTSFLAMILPSPAAACIEIEAERWVSPPESVLLAVDDDDDDDDGVADREQASGVPEEDLLRIRATSSCGLRVEGAARLLRDGGPVHTPLLLRRGEVVGLQATDLGPIAVAVRASGPGGATGTTLEVVPVRIRFLDAANEPIDARRRALQPSRQVTNDATLPRGPGWEQTSVDPDNYRIELEGSLPADARLTVESLPDASSHRDRRVASLVAGNNGRWRTPFLRLVGDEIDRQAPGVSDRVLRVSLRDRVQARVGTARQSLRVGRPGSEDGLLAVRRGRLRVRILRVGAGGTPAVGTNARGALGIGREQLAIANEIWMQCGVSFGDPNEADIRVVDPPPPSLIAIADGDGFPARGDGDVAFMAGGQVIGPVPTRAGAPPIDIALRIGQALERAGLQAVVTENPRTEFGAGPSADVQVRSGSGRPVPVTPLSSRELGTDSRQTVQIASVDLTDGLLEFDNMTAAAGTLEERAMIKALGDSDPTTIDLFIVNRFSSGTRQGEAFIESDGGAIVNTVILDRNGIRQQREAWTQSHEMGHVLLDQPFHPDNVGPDEPWRLMDADSSLGLVTGPKRLTVDECRRARQRSGVDAVPSLLQRD
ncbi:MAG: hypothetical protein AAGF12_35720 [Myxococcota bacterium]